MIAKNYFFTFGCVATAEEKRQNDELGFIFVNGQCGDSFKRDVGKVAGNVPEHLKKFDINNKATKTTKKKASRFN